LEGSGNCFSPSVIPAKAGRWIHTEMRQLFDKDLGRGVEVKEWDRTIHASENRLICCHGGVGARMSDSSLKAALSAFIVMSQKGQNWKCRNASNPLRQSVAAIQKC
jgi:hypothetical protein